MKQKYIVTGILIAVLTLPASSFAAADSPVTDDGTIPVVVSLGDSYSSGEGIEPYYGQESSTKYRNEDWICHRSELSWPGMLEVNGTTLSSVRGTNYSCADGLVSTEGTGENWYFGAVSGAVTKNIYSDNDQDRQAKTVSPLVGQRSDTRYQLNFQIDTITSLPDPSMIDYVTLTIGGNDVDFTGIITEAMLSDYVNLSKDGLKQKLVNTIESFWETTDGSTPMAEKLENTYRKILEAAPNAKLIVAGYPQLIHYDTKISSSLYTDNQSIGELAGDVVLTISDSEAKLIDDAVSTFDQYIKTIVENRMDGENIAFVDVQDAFAGHEAYSDDPYIEGLVLGLSENVDKSGTGSVISSASFHPNEKGAKAYAGAVQEVFTQYDENPVLAVCDETGNSYGDFAVKIEGTQYTEQFLFGSHLTLSMSTSYSQEMNAGSTEPLQLTLTKGDYTITVTDQSNPENSISKDIKVRKNYDGKVIQMSGDFGAGNTADAYAAYEVILDEYRAACAVDSMSYFADMETYEAMYPDVNPFELYEYHVPYHVNPFNDSEYEKHELMYTYYDIDQNGTPELLIFESSWQQDICDIYAFDGTAAVKLFPDITLLDTRNIEFVSVAVYDDGTLCVMSGDSTPYRFNIDGYTLETIPWDEWEWEQKEQISFDNNLEMLAEDIPSEGNDISSEEHAEDYAAATKEIDSYSSIIEEYRKACNIDDNEFISNSEYYLDLYSNVAAVCMRYYHIYNDGDFYYTYYDVNQDGQDEFLISYGHDNYYNLVDLYTYTGTKVLKAVDSNTLGDRSRLDICTDGTLIFLGSGGTSEEYDFLEIASNGYSINTVSTYTADWNAYPAMPYYDGSRRFTADEMEGILNSYTKIDNATLEWTPIY